MKNITIYTDGAYSDSRKQGGASFIIIENDKEIYKGSQAYKNTTSQRMELYAVINALRALKEPCIIDLYTDSMYVVNLLLDKYEALSNVDLVNQLKLLRDAHYSVNPIWVQGHNGNKYNEECDRLAVLETKLLP